MKNKHQLDACRTFSDVLRYNSCCYPRKVWLHDGITGKDYSFVEFDHLVDRGVSFLLQKGCCPGDIISVAVNNRIEYLILFFASFRLGTIFSPLPFSLSSHDIAKNVAYLDPKMVFCQHKHYQDLKSKFSNLELIIDEKEGGDFLKALSNINLLESADFSPRGHEPACIYYSSGTTGNPKGIVFSHKNMIANISSIVRGFKWQADDCHLVFLPLGHTASINYSVLPCMYAGARIALYESFWKIRNIFWQCLEKTGATYVEVVPSVLFSLLNTAYKDYNRDHLKRLKYIGCGSAPLPLEVQEKIFDRFQLKAANLYGLSETGPTHVDDPLVPDWKPGSLGRPLDVNEVKIFDENGQPVKDGETGEIAVKGENVFVGYYNNEDAYKKVFKNGYFLTGDLGYVNGRGLFYFADRKKDLIIKGGVNIFPGEIDEAIFAHPCVKEVATVGVSDNYLGERIKSFIVLKQGVVLKEEEIRRFCLEKLGDFKCPNEFVFLDEIPKGPSGKLLRRLLKETRS